jgi:hypothetical protein
MRLTIQYLTISLNLAKVQTVDYPFTNVLYTRTFLRTILKLIWVYSNYACFLSNMWYFLPLFFYNTLKLIEKVLFSQKRDWLIKLATYILNEWNKHLKKLRKKAFRSLRFRGILSESDTLKAVTHVQ